MGARIAIECQALRSRSGTTRIIQALASGLNDAGFEVDLYAESVEKMIPGTRWRRLVPFPLSERFLRKFIGPTWVGRLKQKRIADAGYALSIGNKRHAAADLFLVHNVYARELAELGGAGSSHEQNLLAEETRVLGSREVRCFVVNSTLTARALEQCYGVSAERCAVLYPGYDPDKFGALHRPHLRAAARRELSLNEGQLLAGFVTSGNFPLRGSDIFIDTLAAVPEASRTGLQVLCVGSTANTTEFAARMQLKCPGIRLLQRRHSEHIERYYAALDLLFHPARFETFGLVVLEAAAIGTPVLTSRASGAAEVLGEQASGLIADTPKVETFLPLLQQLLASTGQRQALAASQAAAVKPYTWDRYTSGFIDLIRKRELLKR